jgi:hypothetical protein
VRRLFTLLQENKEELLQPSPPISGVVAEERRAPFLSVGAAKKPPATSLYVGGEPLQQGASPLKLSTEPHVLVQEYRGLDPVIRSGSWFVAAVKAVLQTFFDISRVVLHNKEIFSILGIFLALILGMIVVYSTHFR